MEQPILDERIAKDDLAFVIKKFGISISDFNEIMKQPRVEHSEFLKEEGFRKRLWIFRVLNWLKSF